SAQMGPAQIGPAQTGPAQTGPAPYPSFNGFQAGGIQNGSQASGNGTHGGLNPAGFEAAPLPAPPSPYGPINTGYFGGQSGAGEPAPGYGSGQHSMPAHTPPTGPSFQPRPPLHAQAQPQQAQVPQALYSSQQPPPQQAQPSALPAVRPAQPLAVSLPDAVKAAHHEGYTFGESVGRDAPGLWLEAVLARKPRMPSDLEARLLQGSVLPIDSLLHDEVRHSLRRGFWDALESARR
ncbi:MAG TPA: NYN domain-containing protein, partial [Streptosporangiaceae bacterium]|nr:NYN domain-containing protein [Streptosporangiaceae bacterium]